MGYVANWQSLAVAVKLIAGNCTGEADARTQLCKAMSDEAVAVRVKVAPGEADYGGQVIGKDRFLVPEQLTPNDLDWENSRPFREWKVGHRYMDPYSGSSQWRSRSIALVEVSTKDLRKFWGGSDIEILGPRYVDIKFKTAEGMLVRENPVGPSDAATTATTTVKISASIAAEKRLEKYLVTWMVKSPDAPPGKKIVVQKAGADGHVFSSRGFERAYANAVKSANAPKWSMPGPKSKRKIDAAI